MPLTLFETHSGRRPGMTFLWEVPHGEQPKLISTRHVESKDATYYHAYLSCGCVVRAQFKKELDDVA